MPVETWLNAYGAWRKAQQVWTHSGGNWVECKQIWTKQNGTWQMVFQKAFNYTGTVYGNNYNLRNVVLAAGWDGQSPVIANLTVSGNVGSASNITFDWNTYLAQQTAVANYATTHGWNPTNYAQYYYWATSAQPPAGPTTTGGLLLGQTLPTLGSLPAFDTGVLPSGSQVTLTIPSGSYIVGSGGNGGYGGLRWGWNSTSVPPTTYRATAGTPGGDAMHIQVPTTIINNGTIGGGGGGGGGGNGASGGQSYDDPGAAGGGGAGLPAGVQGGSDRSGTFIGQNGTLTSGGAAGVRSYQGSSEWGGAADGGAGGNLGAAGAASLANQSYGLPGGAAGSAVVGSANVTWQVYGTVLGAVA